MNAAITGHLNPAGARAWPGWLAYLLIGPGLGLGLLGAWLAMFADLVVRGAFFLLRFAGGRWRRMRV